MDRLEGDYAVLIGEDRCARDVLRSALPLGIREGDYVREAADGFLPAPEAREDAERRVTEKLRRLRERGRG